MHERDLPLVSEILNDTLNTALDSPPNQRTGDILARVAPNIETRICNCSAVVGL